MKYLTLDLIKKHSRIDFDIEDDLLELYAEASEQTVMDLCNTSYEAMIDEYGEIPAPVKQATLMLVDLSYEHRSPITQAQYSLVPYGFDRLIKKYIKLG